MIFHVLLGLLIGTIIGLIFGVFIVVVALQSIGDKQP
jgi:hypothetical protein